MSQTTRPDPKEKFLLLSSILTGFDTSEIQGTGMVDFYYRTLKEILSPTIFYLFMDEISLDADDKIKGVWLPICDNIVKMWYLGKWIQIDLTAQNKEAALDKNTQHSGNITKILSPAAYREAMAWKIISSNPPGAKQPGFASWSMQP